jgi:plastocyanin
MPRVVILALAVLAVLALAACTQQEPEITANDQVPADQRQEEPTGDGDAADDGAAPADVDEETTWVAVDIDFSEFETELAAGRIAVTLVNEGNLPHDITVEETGDVIYADGGDTVTEVIELEPGTYTWYCSIPGHRATMEETVTVS